ncbi:MAG: metallophosphoesterase [Victivallales bacterium]|nr:metallophosphoesterase [Victivallales bacterium]
MAKFRAISAVSEWRCVRGYSGRILRDSPAPRGFKVVEYHVGVPGDSSLKGKKMLFFADLHYGSIYPDTDACREVIEDISPDWVVFGGDLITYACQQDNAFRFLKGVFGSSDAVKIAVMGNWDRRRVNWYPLANWEDAYASVGFRLLVNQSFLGDGINFYGLDEPRMGHPHISRSAIRKDCLNCIVSHNSDVLIDIGLEAYDGGRQLFLCGHSHGGQVRLPFFGAFVTSGKYWKFFEYGLYCSRDTLSHMIITSGLGKTRLPFRLFCQPEFVVIYFE